MELKSERLTSRFPLPNALSLKNVQSSSLTNDFLGTQAFSLLDENICILVGFEYY